MQMQSKALNQSGKVLQLERYSKSNNQNVLRFFSNLASSAELDMGAAFIICIPEEWTPRIVGGPSLVPLLDQTFAGNGVHSGLMPEDFGMSLRCVQNFRLS